MAENGEVLENLRACEEKKDFLGAFALIRDNQAVLDKSLRATGVREILLKTTNDRVLLSFVNGVDFGRCKLADSLLRLEKLLSFREGALVLSETWGLGKIKRVDYFYRRMTVDFKQRRGHQFTYAAATDLLVLAPENHILMLAFADPTRVEKLLREKKGDFVKEVLKSYGDLTVGRLEELCVANGFVKAQDWKKFWEAARVELRQDKTVVVPVRRTEPIQLRTSVEDYGEAWLSTFLALTDPHLILAGMREFVAQGCFAKADAETKARLGQRLEFAVTAARNVDDALYVRLACQVMSLGFEKPSAAEMRDYLWDRKRYIRAAAALPSREVGAMIAFLAFDEATRAKLYKALPDLCFTAVGEVIAQFGDLPAYDETGNPLKNAQGELVYPCRLAVAELMRQPKAPATLTTLLVGHYSTESASKESTGKADAQVQGTSVAKTVRTPFCKWPELPSLVALLTQAIALGEGRQGGETLKMQNIIRRLFADMDWMKKIFARLNENERALFFERFQASIAWDPSTHHTIVVRMTHLDPGLEAHVVKLEKKRDYARVTSYRSFAVKKAEYLKLINEDMPANIKRIEFAKSYGDLSENAEYQYAKDEQRALMQKQTLMQQDLEVVKPSDFADATTSEVMPGVAVVVETLEGQKTYSILGEWDNAPEVGVLSMKSRLAQNMLGKKVGDEFELPGVEKGVAFGKILQIQELSAEIRAWMEVPSGMQI